LYRDSEQDFIGICDDYAMFFDLTVFLHEVVIDAMAHHSEISTPSALRLASPHGPVRRFNLAHPKLLIP